MGPKNDRAITEVGFTALASSLFGSQGSKEKGQDSENRNEDILEDLLENTQTLDTPLPFSQAD